MSPNEAFWDAVWVAKNIKRIWEGRNEREFLGDLV
jgi:hypothetical protein